MHASLNVGRPDITPNCFCLLLSGFQPLAHTMCLQEFKPSPTAHIRDFERVALHWGFHLLHSSPSSKKGVAILVHTSISPKPPPLYVHIPGVLVSVELHLHPNPLMPPMHLASFYGPHTLKEKLLCKPYLDAMIRDSYLIMGDYNGTTHESHTTTLRANVLPWLAAKAKAGSLVDLLLPHTDSIPYTRVRRFAGTKSYIDRAYGTGLYHNSFEVSSARVIDFSSVHGASDHDPIAVSTLPWTTPHLPETRCAQ